MKFLKRLSLAILSLLIVVLLLVLFLVRTETGTRTILSLAESWFPEPLSVGAVSGTLSDQLFFESLRWKDAAVDVHLRNVAVDVQLRDFLARRLTINRLSVERSDVVINERATPATQEQNAEPFSLGMPIAIELRQGVLSAIQISTGGSTYEIGSLELAATISGSSLQVDRLIVESPLAGLATRGEFQLEVPYSSDVTVQWSLEAEGQSFSGEGQLSGDWRAFDIEHSLQSPYSVRTNGQLAAKNGLSFELTNEWSELAVPVGDRTLESAEGSLDLDGTLSDFSLALATRLQIDKNPPLELRLSGSGTPESIVLKRVSVDGAGAALALDGEIRIGSAGASWDIALNGQGINPAVIGAPASGDLSIDAKVVGEFVNWETFSTDALLTSLGGTLNGQPVKGSGELKLANGEVQFDTLNVWLGKNSVRANGKVAADSGDFDAEIRAPVISQLWPGFSGSLTATLGITGSLELASVKLDLSAKDLKAGQIVLGQADIQAQGDGRAGSSLSVKLTDANLAGTQFTAIDVAADGALEEHDVRIQLKSGDAVASFGFKGGLAEKNYLGELKSGRLQFPDVRDWSLLEPSTFAVGPETQRLERTCFSASADERICVLVNRQANSGALQAEMLVRALPVGPLLATRIPSLDANGIVSGDLSVLAFDGGLSGEYRFSLAEGFLAEKVAAETREQSEVLRVPLTIEVDGAITDGTLLGKLNVASGSDGSLTADYRLEDLLADDGAIAINGNLDYSNLDVFSLLLPGIDLTSGSIAATLAVSGTRAVPIGGGNVDVRDAAMRVSALGTRIIELNLSVKPADAGRWSIAGGFTSGEGALSVTGLGDLRKDAVWLVDLDVDGDAAELVRLPDLLLTASPDLSLQFGRNAMRVSGRLLVPRASIVLDELPEGADQSSPDVVVHRAEEAIGDSNYPVEMDLELVAGEDVALTGYGLKAKLRGQLGLKGASIDVLQGFGELSLNDGVFKAYGQELTIDRGRLIFTGPLDNPRLDFRATRKVKVGTVGLQMLGTVLVPSSSLFSDPVLSDVETLSYLLTGRGLDGGASDNGNLMAGAAVALGLSQAGKIAAEVRSSIGLDELSIAGEGDSGELLAGKWIGSDLYLQYAFGIFDKIGSVLLRYRVSERLTFESRSGREQSLDLIYSVGRE